jgi:outer membrane protein assembly factor BamA
MSRSRRFLTLGLSLALLLILLILPAPAGAQDYWGKTVTSISYEPAKQPIDPHDLTDSILISVGQPLDRLQLAASIDRLFATGLYDDVQVDGEPSAGGVSVRFITVPRRFIGHVDARGKIKDPPNRAVIIGDAQLSLGQPFDPALVETARKNIEQELRRNGLFKGQVAATSVEDPVNHQMTIGFVVNAGKRARYEAPVINGDTKLPNETIIAATGWRIRFIHRWRQVTKELAAFRRSTPRKTA